MRTGAIRYDTGFRPTRHGFPFPNAWRDALLGVFASRGRCGGMVFAALDYFLAGEDVPDAGKQVPLPAHDAPIARLIWRRQVASVLAGAGTNLWRFALLTYLPSSAPLGTQATTRREIDRLLEALEAGRPVPLGLVSALTLRHLARNHQVLAYGAEVGDDAVLVRVYDPNHPRRDDVMLEVPRSGGPVVERIGTRRTTWRGLFVERYAPIAGVRSGVPLAERRPDLRRVWPIVVAAAAGLALRGLVPSARRTRG